MTTKAHRHSTEHFRWWTPGQVVVEEEGRDWLKVRLVGDDDGPDTYVIFSIDADKAEFARKWRKRW